MIGEFFIALFGSLYYGGKYIAGKSATYESNDSFNRSYTSAENWRNSVTNFNKEHDLQVSIDVEKEYKKYSNLLENRGLKLGTNGLSIMEAGFGSATSSNLNDYKKNICMRLMLAEKGMIPFSEIQGVKVWGPSSEKGKIQWKFMQIWDSILQEHGLPPMVFSPFDSSWLHPDLNRITLVSQWNGQEPSMGLFYWKEGQFNYYYR